MIKIYTCSCGNLGVKYCYAHKRFECDKCGEPLSEWLKKDLISEL